MSERDCRKGRKGCTTGGSREDDEPQEILSHRHTTGGLLFPAREERDMGKVYRYKFFRCRDRHSFPYLKRNTRWFNDLLASGCSHTIKTGYPQGQIGVDKENARWFQRRYHVVAHKRSRSCHTCMRKGTSQIELCKHLSFQHIPHIFLTCKRFPHEDPGPLPSPGFIVLQYQHGQPIALPG